MLVSTLEKKLLLKFDYIIGIDEAGRGPWAGPVAIVGFMLSKKNLHKQTIEVDDSKKLTKKNRQLIFKEIAKKSNLFHVVIKDSNTIDECGIGKAIESGISEIIHHFQKTFKKQKLFFLIDGYFKMEFNCNYKLIKKGDSKIYSIASASIIAKETRDNIMYDFSKQYPEYFFEKHVGYGTRLHQKQLQIYGPCPIHRKSFKPIADLLTQN